MKQSTDEEVFDRIVSRIVANGECLEWTSTINKSGYGLVVIGWRYNHEPVRRGAHRTLYELIHGEVGGGLEIDHLCRNRACVNPEHLEAVTKQENIRRGILSDYMKEKTKSRIYCDKGLHLYAGNNIRKNGKGNVCRECRNEYKRRIYHMRKPNSPKPILHGENAIVPVSEMPKGLTKKYNSYVIGHSESGHHHVLEAVKGQEFEIFVKGDDIFISSRFKSSVVHKKTKDIHKTVKVEPGIYRVNRKTEYDPFKKALRQVWD